MEHLERFEGLWNDFLMKLKGQMIRKANTGMLTFPTLDLMIASSRNDWISKDTVSGRWLAKYEEENPKKGALIVRILTEDMHFQKVDEKSGVSPIVLYGVPAVGACLAAGVAVLLKATVLYTAAAAVATPAVLYPVMSKISEMTAGNNRDAEIETYIQQLDLYKNAVLDVLKS